MLSRLRIFLTVLSVGSVLTSDSQAVFQSEIFRYDDPNNALGLHTSLQGTTRKRLHWSGREVRKEDTSFYQDLFSEESVIKYYADRQPRTREATQVRVDNWVKNCADGHPDQILTIGNPQNDNEKFGFIATSNQGDGPGSSEIYYAYMPSCSGKKLWDQKLGSGALHAVVHKLAPETRRIGLGVNLSELKHMNIINAFKCFGGEALSHLYATAGPSNIASWKMLDNENFEASRMSPKNGKFIEVDLSDIRPDDALALENKLLEFFTPSTKTPLEVGVRYQFTAETKLRTFSKHEKFGCIKYHFKRLVD